MKFKANAVLIDKDMIELDFEIKSTDFFLYKVQSLPSKYYNMKTKTWTTPCNKVTVEYLKKWGFKLDPKIVKQLQLKDEQPELIDPKLLLPLRDYQKESLGFIDSRNGRALLGLDAGLGKSAVALGWMKYRKKYPTLIVCPASLKLNWENEVKKFLGKESVVLYGSPQKSQRLIGDIIIINYDILKKWETLLLKKKFELMIIDESQVTKNSSAQRTKAVLKLSGAIPCVIPMSATSVENGPMDLFTTFKIINKKLFPNKHQFGIRYCGAVHNGWGWKYPGATNIKELIDLLGDVMIRRKKSDVLKELPDKTRAVVPIELDNRKEYVKCENTFLQWYRMNQGQKVNAMAKMEALKQLTNKGKFNQIIEWIGNYLESGNKLIVFGIHIDQVESIHKQFKQSVLLYGKMNSKQKQKSVDDFQNDKKIRLMVANIKSGGVGLNLTAAPDTCTIELPWNPAILEQAESRVHRIGQTADKVTNYYLIAPRTIEEDMMSTLDAKQKIMDKILDGVDTPSDDLLTVLIKKMKDRR